MSAPLTTTEAAARLGISDSLVRRWCRDMQQRGSVPIEQHGKYWLVTEVVFAELQARHTRGPGWRKGAPRTPAGQERAAALADTLQGEKHAS